MTNFELMRDRLLKRAGIGEEPADPARAKRIFEALWNSEWSKQ